MSKKLSQVNVGWDTAAQQALALFEESLEMLDGHRSIGVDSSETLPALPLSSLLGQCEAMSASWSLVPPSLSLLIAMPGVPALTPAWWRARFAGLVVRQMSVADRSDSGFKAWADAVCEGGEPLLLTATPDVRLPDGVQPHATVLLVCHPYRAFHALPDRTALTLGAYCAGVLAALKGLAGIKPVQVETLYDPCRELGNALQLPASVTALCLSSGDTPNTTMLPPYFEGGNAYKTLCAQLGYKQDALPDWPSQGSGVMRATYHLGNGHKRSDSPALISAFLARAAQVRRKLHPEAAPLEASAIVSILDTCVDAGDEGFLDQFDLACDQLHEGDGALACLAAAAHFQARGEDLTSQSFIGRALVQAPLGASWLRVLAATAFADLNVGAGVLTALTYDALASGVLATSDREKLAAVIAKTSSVKVSDHGHVLLMDALNAHPPLEIERERVLIEIGTTRELVLGQGSTQKLAEMCSDFGLTFITVDMDPNNTRHAARMFAREGYDFQAVTAKGEDFLAQYDGLIDYVFLDAYDFDHGHHSAIRQDRYARFLGSRIEEEQCHKMHLDCAESLIVKLTPEGLICFDDTWTDTEGNWTAKGTTAMPFLLENGFSLIEARNRAALLRRSDPAT